MNQKLPDIELIGMENWQLFYLLLAVLLGWPSVSLLCWALNRMLARREGLFQSAITQFLRLQFRVFLYIMVLRYAVTHIGLPIKTLLLLQSSGIIYIASIVLLLGLINLAVDYQARRIYGSGNAHYVALLKPAASLAKVLVVISVCLIWASDYGFNISTILAGLGVGSLAVEARPNPLFPPLTAGNRNAQHGRETAAQPGRESGFLLLQRRGRGHRPWIGRRFGRRLNNGWRNQGAGSSTERPINVVNHTGPVTARSH